MGGACGGDGAVEARLPLGLPSGLKPGGGGGAGGAGGGGGGGAAELAVGEAGIGGGGGGNVREAAPMWNQP